MDETEARKIAEEWLREKYSYLEVEIVTGESKSTKKSWIFCIHSKDGTALYGNVPIAVNKKTGEVSVPHGTGIEFVPSDRFTLVDRLKRWWYRRSY
jgi:hypothetical protein